MSGVVNIYRIIVKTDIIYSRQVTPNHILLYILPDWLIFLTGNKILPTSFSIHYRDTSFWITEVLSCIYLSDENQIKFQYLDCVKSKYQN